MKAGSWVSRLLAEPGITRMSAIVSQTAGNHCLSITGIVTLFIGKLKSI